MTTRTATTRAQYAYAMQLWAAWFNEHGIHSTRNILGDNLIEIDDDEGTITATIVLRDDSTDRMYKVDGKLATTRFTFTSLITPIKPFPFEQRRKPE